MEHLRAIKVERHLKFAKEKEMANFNVSAKTGESVRFKVRDCLGLNVFNLLFFFYSKVNLMFQQVAAHILGIQLTRIQQEDQHRVVKAEIVKYKEAPAPTPKTKKSSICSIQ